MGRRFRDPLAGLRRRHGVPIARLALRDGEWSPAGGGSGVVLVVATLGDVLAVLWPIEGADTVVPVARRHGTTSAAKSGRCPAGGVSGVGLVVGQGGAATLGAIRGDVLAVARPVDVDTDGVHGEAV
jgi:hypothetical protein